MIEEIQEYGKERYDIIKKIKSYNKISTEYKAKVLPWFSQPMYPSLLAIQLKEKKFFGESVELMIHMNFLNITLDIEYDEDISNIKHMLEDFEKFYGKEILIIRKRFWKR